MSLSLTSVFYPAVPDPTNPGHASLPVVLLTLCLLSSATLSPSLRIGSHGRHLGDGKLQSTHDDESKKDDEIDKEIGRRRGRDTENRSKYNRNRETEK